MKGIEFKLIDGSLDCYDPVDLDKDFKETDTHYILDMTYLYEIDKAIVESIRYYDLCEACGREVNNICEYCNYD